MAKKKTFTPKIKITRAEKSVLVELGVLGSYGGGVESAWEFIDDIGVKHANNHLVKGSLARKGLAIYYTDVEPCVKLTSLGYELAQKEIQKYESPHEAFNINRMLNR